MNDLGQRTAVDASGTAFGTSQRDRTWKYDSFGQLVSEADSNNAGFDRGFAFDDIGNRTASISGDTDPSATGAISYTPDALNQYDTITDPASQVSAPSYDADGNATSLSLRKTGLPAPAGSFEDATLIWDGENRLIEIKAANNTTLAKYKYDSQSRRIRRNESAAHDTAYLYDGWNPIAEYRLSAGTYDLHLTNLWGLDLSGSMQKAGGVGGLLAVNVSGTTYYPTYDGNGNVSEYLEHIIDSDPGTAGNQPLTETAVHFEYDAFGNILDFTETSTDLVDTFSHRFSTKQQDHESGLLYYGYRYYDPVTGRWPSRDPIGERGGMNLYGMVGNDVVNTTDYLGLDKCDHSGHAGNRKFVLEKVSLGGITRTGKPADDLIRLGQKLLNNIQNLGRVQAAGNAAAGAVAGGAAKGIGGTIEGLTPDATILSIGEAHPDLVDFVGKAFKRINDGSGNRIDLGAMITIESKCLTCVCDEADWYNPAEWFSGDIWEWDDPDLEMTSFQVKEETGEVVGIDDREGWFRVVADITAEDINNAIEIVRKKCK